MPRCLPAQAMLAGHSGAAHERTEDRDRYRSRLLSCWHKGRFANATCFTRLINRCPSCRTIKSDFSASINYRLNFLRLGDASQIVRVAMKVLNAAVDMRFVTLVLENDSNTEIDQVPGEIVLNRDFSDRY